MSAERCANSHLSGAGVATREQQIGNIRAGDQQHQSHCRQQHSERRANVSGHILLQREDADAPVFSGCGIFGGELLSDGLGTGEAGTVEGMFKHNVTTIVEALK